MLWACKSQDDEPSAIARYAHVTDHLKLAAINALASQDLIDAIQ